jgi:polyhydroxyalkanoate synthesis repressor PhaR
MMRRNERHEIETSKLKTESLGRREKFSEVIRNGHGGVLTPLGGKLINHNHLNGGIQEMGHMTAAGKASAKTKIIKRYQNRKLYDTQQSCYVTLDDIAKMIRTNEEVMVIDNKTKNDITSATLTQIIFEAEKKASTYAPLFTLREIIQNANGSISSYLAKLGAIPHDYVRNEAAVAAPERSSTDDLKQSLENRVAKAAQAETSEFGSRFASEETPSLPNSNKSLNN